MTTPALTGLLNQSVVQVKIETNFELKTEDFKTFDGKVTATADIKIEPVDKLKVEKTEEDSDEMTAEFHKSGMEEVVDRILLIKRWMSCVPFKSVVEGTPFVPFKMPFSGSAVQPCSSEKSFSIADLMKRFPNIGLIIDLSNYCRTYRVSDLMALGVQYVNIPVQFEHPNSVPDAQQLERFIQTCSTYSAMHPNKLIGVHDQLGNRATPYMICKAMERTGISTQQAMKRFNDARGYAIYEAMAGVLNGSRRPWFASSEFKPDVKRLGANRNEKTIKRRANRQRRASRKRKANKQRKTEGTACNMLN